MLFVHPPSTVARGIVRLCQTHVKRIMRPKIRPQSIRPAVACAGMTLLCGRIRNASKTAKPIRIMLSANGRSQFPVTSISQPPAIARSMFSLTGKAADIALLSWPVWSGPPPQAPAATGGRDTPGHDGLTVSSQPETAPGRSPPARTRCSSCRTLGRAQRPDLRGVPRARGHCNRSMSGAPDPVRGRGCNLLQQKRRAVVVRAPSCRPEAAGSRTDQ